MRVSRKRRYAVLTGDVVASRTLDSRARRSLSTDIRKVGTRIREEYPDVCPLDVDTFRGDSWQLLVVRPELALEVAVLFRAALRWITDERRIDSRVAIGIGKIEFIAGNRVSEGDGEAFRRSGAALDAMGGRTRIALARETPETELTLAAIALLDGIVQSWTPSRCQAVIGALAGRTQESIAESWIPAPISQQGVAQHLDGAHWHAVERGLAALSASLADGAKQA